MRKQKRSDTLKYASRDFYNISLVFTHYFQAPIFCDNKTFGVEGHNCVLLLSREHPGRWQSIFGSLNSTPHIFLIEIL